MNSNQKLLNLALHHGQRLALLEKAEARKIGRFLEKELFPEVLDAIAARASRLKTASVKTAQFKETIAAMRAKVKEGMSSVYGKTKDAVVKHGLKEAKWQVGVLVKSTPIQWNFEFPDPSVVRAIVTSRPVHGAILKDWFGGLSKKTASKIEQQLNLGLARGQTYTEISKRILATDAKIIAHNAEAIARTALNHVQNEARELAAKENSDIVKGWQFVATLDTRTSEICQEQDGRVYELGEGQKPPLHFNCRSDFVPVMRSLRELGFDLKEFPPAVRASMNGEVPERTTYKEWSKSRGKGA